MLMMRCVPLAVCMLALGGGDAAAQTLRQQCTGPLPADAERCGALADAASIGQARVAVGFAGGNPMSGSASTLGMRLGSVPRLSLGGRITTARAATPDFDFTTASVSLDGAVGVYQGISLLPTVGGFASLDVLGSVGVMPLPSGGQYGSAPASWAIGARVGILRESFTAPGVSVSAMYRGIGDFSRLEPASSTAPQAAATVGFELSDQRVTSLRAVLGKRIFGIGVTGGVGQDRLRADATVRYTVFPGGLPESFEVVEVRQPTLRQNRNLLFVNASMTMLILNLSAEAGWQQGGERGSTGSPELGKGGLFGGIAARVAI